jgi:hypothetical protein
MQRRNWVLACVLAAVAAWGCGTKEPNEPPAATASVTLNHDRVPIGSPLTLTYRFEVAPNAAFDGDYRVFVHVLDPEGEQLWTDDHDPAVPTSKWKPGQKIEYSRTVFVPSYPYIGEAKIRLGLYSPGSSKRLVLAAKEVSRREYELATFQLLAQSENIFIIYKEGWHPAEVAPDNPAVEWQWTKKSATISFRNPKKDSTFYLEADARPDLFTPPQQVTIRAAGTQIATLPADFKDQKLLTFPIGATQFGNADMAEITIDVDRTFTPGGTDRRELGIRVYHTFIEPK